MLEYKNAAAAAKRIAHIASHVSASTRHSVENAQNNILNGTGSPKGSAMSLSNHAEAMAMHSWFTENSLEAMRQWWFVAANLDMLTYQYEVDTFAPGGYALKLMKPLLSNNAALIERFSHYEAPFDAVYIEDPKENDYWAYQFMLALRGDWARLSSRCDLVLAQPDIVEDSKYLIDHKFFKSLSSGDRDGMETALTELVSPKAVKARSSDDSGYGADLISTAGVIHAKIAWLHGHQIKIDSPYIPAEWLPMDPLPVYKPQYPFFE